MRTIAKGRPSASAHRPSSVPGGAGGQGDESSGKLPIRENRIQTPETLRSERFCTGAADYLQLRDAALTHVSASARETRERTHYKLEIALHDRSDIRPYHTLTPFGARARRDARSRRAKRQARKGGRPRIRGRPEGVCGRSGTGCCGREGDFILFFRTTLRSSIRCCIAILSKLHYTTTSPERARPEARVELGPAR